MIWSLIFGCHWRVCHRLMVSILDSFRFAVLPQKVASNLLSLGISNDEYLLIYGIFILVKIFPLNLFGMELIYHLKLGDLCEKIYLFFFFFEYLFNNFLNYMIFFLIKILDNAIQLDYWYNFLIWCS